MAESRETLRAFVAIEVEPKIVRALGQFQRALEEALPKETVRWALPDHLHLTVRFLGNMAAEAVDPVAAALRKICRQENSFRLRAAGLGGFPNLRSPRVIWVGLQGDLPELQKLQTQIQEATRDFGQPPESRAFHPHLTLGRVREAAVRQARNIGKALQAAAVPEFGEWPVNEIRLMRSQLSPHGAHYSVLAAAPMAGEGSRTDIPGRDAD